jgi:hypothetical protein
VTLVDLRKLAIKKQVKIRFPAAQRHGVRDQRRRSGACAGAEGACRISTWKRNWRRRPNLWWSRCRRRPEARAEDENPLSETEEHGGGRSG